MVALDILKINRTTLNRVKMMKRNEKGFASDLLLGDRFYQANDKAKVVKQVMEIKPGEILVCTSEMAGKTAPRNLWNPIKPNTHIVYLRPTIKN